MSLHRLCTLGINNGSCLHRSIFDCGGEELVGGERKQKGIGGHVTAWHSVSSLTNCKLILASYFPGSVPDFFTCLSCFLGVFFVLFFANIDVLHIVFSSWLFPCSIFFYVMQKKRTETIVRKWDASQLWETPKRPSGALIVVWQGGHAS